MVNSRYFMVGNWKMHQTTPSIQQFFEEFYHEASDLNCEAWVAPQFIHIPLCQETSAQYGDKLKIGAQNCSHQEQGAFTGEVSPLALADLKATFVIIGHSERRSLFNEGHLLLNQKLHQALKQKLNVIFCIGESLEERESGKTESVISEQLLQGLQQLGQQHFSQILLAYEPVWAIGTGKTATPQEAQQVHAFIRKLLKANWGQAAASIPLLYGGSVKPDNAKQLLSEEDIDGALVGGASLQAQSFKQLCQIASDLAKQTR